MPEPRTTAPITLSLPLQVEQKLRALASHRGVSMSALAAELLEAGRAAPQREEELEARIAKLEAELTIRPPPDFRDSMLKLTPGTSHLVRQRDDARAECAKLKEKLVEAEAEALEWQESSAAWEQECEELEKTISDLQQHKAQDQKIVEGLQAKMEAKNTELANQKRAHQLDLQRNKKVNFRAGVWFSVPMVAAAIGLLLFIVPHDTWAMRTVAAAAMGKTFAREKAAARLHGMPLQGIETQIQLYALSNTDPNRERLDECFKKVAAIPAKARRQTVDCKISIPSELEVESILFLKGPFELPSELRKDLRRNETAIVGPRTSPREQG